MIANNLVGVELLEPKRGETDYSVDGEVPTVSGRRFHGLFLSLRKRNGDTPIQTLIVPAGEYQPGKRLQMSVGNSSAQSIAFGRLLEQQPDWIWATDRIARTTRRAGRFTQRLTRAIDAGRSLSRDLRAASLERSADFNIAAAVCTAPRQRSARGRDALGRRGRRERDADLPRAAAAGRPPAPTRSPPSASVAATKSRSSCRSDRRPPSRTSPATSWARSRYRCRSCSAPTRSNTASEFRRPRSVFVDPASLPNLAAIRDRLPRALRHVDRRRRRARVVDDRLGRLLQEASTSKFTPVVDARHRSGAARSTPAAPPGRPRAR